MACASHSVPACTAAAALTGFAVIPSVLACCMASSADCHQPLTREPMHVTNTPAAAQNATSDTQQQGKMLGMSAGHPACVCSHGLHRAGLHHSDHLWQPSVHYADCAGHAAVLREVRPSQPHCSCLSQGLSSSHWGCLLLTPCLLASRMQTPLAQGVVCLQC